MICQLFIILCASYMTVGSMFDVKQFLVLKAPGTAKYFGVSVVLRRQQPACGLVGAPKAVDGQPAYKGLGPTGSVFSCDLANLTSKGTVRNCTTMNFDSEGNTVKTDYHHYKNEMMLGASMADVTQGTIVACAPKWINQNLPNYQKINGCCYAIGKRTTYLLLPFKDSKQQIFTLDGKRKIYGQANQNIYFYIYGQFGFSVHISEDEKWLLMGAPGVMSWTGTVVRYGIMKGLYPGLEYIRTYQVFNPYFSEYLEPENYFGYSVESGAFEPGMEVLGVSGAPRALNGLGAVLIFDLEYNVPYMNVRMVLKGSQIGSYFGAALLVSDVNGDGRPDLIVGAPNHAYIRENTFDNGKAYVYINKVNTRNKRNEINSFRLELKEELVGSSGTGARFGTALADLGDVDENGYPEIAIGAPYESGGVGAVYIYRGTSEGLVLSQRIPGDGETGFGISISRGYDVDENGCNDFMVGAFLSSSAIVYRCRPTLHVESSVDVPRANLIFDETMEFEAVFCVRVNSSLRWPRAIIDLEVHVATDSDSQVFFKDGERDLKIRIHANSTWCRRRTVSIRENADRSKPIELFMKLDYSLDEVNGFCPDCPRPSDDSKLRATSGPVHLTQGCGEDHTCQPVLSVLVQSQSGTPFVPGVTPTLDVLVSLLNQGEPAYKACLKIQLPSLPKRLQSDCTFNHTDLICMAPNPLRNHTQKSWMLELEPPKYSDCASNATVTVAIHNNCQSDISDSTVTYNVTVEPKVSLTLNGRSFPNASLQITEQYLEENQRIVFSHRYTISNDGPSVCWNLVYELEVPLMVDLEKVPKNCAVWKMASDSRVLRCFEESLAAKSQFTRSVQMAINKTGIEEYLIKDGLFVFVSQLRIIKEDTKSVTYSVETALLFEVEETNWFVILISALSGLVLLTCLVILLYKMGFFVRSHKEMLDNLIQEGDSSSIDKRSTCGPSRSISLSSETDGTQL